MQNKKIISIFSIILFVINMFAMTAFADEAVINGASAIIEIAGSKDDDITITDVRKQAASVSRELSKEQIDEIITMVNDYYNGEFGDEKYYVDISSALTESEVEDIYTLIEGGEVDGDSPRGSGVSLDIKTIGLIAAGAVVVIMVVIFVVVAIIKKGSKPKTRPQPGSGDSSLFAEPTSNSNSVPQQDQYLQSNSNPEPQQETVSQPEPAGNNNTFDFL